MCDILRWFEENDWEIELKFISKSVHGDCDWDKKKIRLNVALSICDSLVHEYMHAKHESWSEAQVLDATYRRLQRMTVAEITELARRVLEEC